MGQPRNSCMARGNLAAGVETAIYTVPAGFTALVKDLRVFATGSGAGTAYVSLKAASGSPQVYLVWNQNYTANVFAWSGWFAMNAGDQMLLSISGNASLYWLSGAQLPYAP